MEAMSEAATVSLPFALETPISALKGVGGQRAAVLAAAGVETIGDLLYRAPLRYEDRTLQTEIGSIEIPTPPVRLRGRLRFVRSRLSPVRRIDVTEAVLEDSTGAIQLVWFGRPYLTSQFSKGDVVAVFGQPRVVDGRLRIDGSAIEPLRNGRQDAAGILPVYSQIGSVAPGVLRRIIEQAIEGALPLLDPVLAELLARLHLPSRSAAMMELHFPRHVVGGKLPAGSPALRRLVFDEFLAYQLSLRMRRGARTADKERAIRVDDAKREQLRRILPFQLTPGQRRVLREIAQDLCSPAPMQRLLQGDVGSGKTIVGLLAASLVVLNGHQVALLAPTEILAEQHYQRTCQLLAGGPVRTALLTGSLSRAERRDLLARLAAGQIDLIVGTHALLQQGVNFASLGMVIVDEQHRFGVEQRRTLVEKGDRVDLLAMTATPIPRSLALTLYGDLDVSTLDDVPPGRSPVRTLVRGASRLPKIFDFLRERIAAGGQAYVVYPIIDENENSSVRSLMKGCGEVREALPDARVDVLHGRMSSADKERVMSAFSRGDLDVLVATTVVEVGVDVAGADFIVIMDADRYGLAQLHQLRGRVGRGERPGVCVLVRDERAGEDVKARLREFAATNDGFAVAERDLRLRGAGDPAGTRQSGMPRFRFGDPVSDLDLMIAARDAAAEMARRSPPAAIAAVAAALAPGLVFSGPGGRD